MLAVIDSTVIVMDTVVVVVHNALVNGCSIARNLSSGSGSSSSRNNSRDR